MIDYSFIRLEPTITQGRYTRPSAVANTYFLDQIQLSTNEFYCQTTNCKDGIAFGGNYSVYVTDCNGNELLDITSKVSITEFTYDGLPQIKFEIAPIVQDFYKKTVLLKFVHTVSDYVWYSNPLIISNYEIEFTTRFNYRSYDGSDSIANVMKSIRLRCFFERNDAKSEVSEYTRIDGMKVSGRLVLTNLEHYTFERLDNFTFIRLNALLSNPVVYVNGNRATNKQTLKSSERTTNTNVWKQEIELPVNYNDVLVDTPQLFGSFDLINFYPSGNYSSATITYGILLDYNRNLTYQSGGTIKLFKDGVLFQTFTVIDITESNASVTTLPLTFGEYRVEISEGCFLSDFNELSEFAYFEFSVLSGEYSNSEYSNEFLIN